jgi:hypothetical protein
MTSDFVIAEFNRFTAQLLAAVSDLPGVIGLVMTGSAVDQSRLDEWSDHDFTVVLAEGAQQAVRDDSGWLPHSESIVLVGEVPGEGFRAVYADGHVLEFVVTTLAELATFAATDYDVILDRGGVEEVMAAISVQHRPDVRIDPAHAVGQFLALILIGVGRARRGEALSASAAVRTAATAQLVDAWQSLREPTHPRLIDKLDNWRRFELVYPEGGSEISDALGRPVEVAARALLDLAERRLRPGWPDWPDAAVAAVRARLGW